MPNQQKVTLYIPPELHRKLKIRAAIDTESMSALVQKAISFYLQYPEQVEQSETSTQSNVHQVHICPECEAAVVMRDGEMISLKNQPGVIEEELPLPVREGVAPDKLHGEEELVPC